MIGLARRWLGGGADVLCFAGAGATVALDPAPPAVLDELREALWERNDDTLVCGFRLDAPCRFADEADFRAFFEDPAVRAGLLGATENLSKDQASYLLDKPVLFGGVAFGFEHCPTAAARGGLFEALGSTREGARLADAFAAQCLGGDVRVFRSGERWPYWLVGDRSNALVVHDRSGGRVVVVAVIGSEPSVTPVPYGGEELASFETRWPNGASPPDLEPLADTMPAVDAFARSFRLASPGSAIAVARFSSAIARGEPTEVARHFDGTDLLGRVLGAPEASRRLGCAPLPAPTAGGTLGFRRLDPRSRAARFAALLESGGTFGERRLEAPADVERLVAGLGAELWGPDPTRALVYETSVRWSSWFSGLLRATIVAVEPATGRVSVLLICEWD